jgi:RNA-directed DNA polymerase
LHGFLPLEKRGSIAYFRLADTGNLVREADRWLRRLRQIRWKEWKTTASRRHNLRVRGISESNVRKWGGSSKGYWRIAGSQILGVTLPNTYWDHLASKP